MTFMGGGYAYFILGIVTGLVIPLIIGAIIMYRTNRRNRNEDNQP